MILGSRSKAAWPLAPGTDTGVIQVKMELTSGSVEYEEEMIRNRMEVAQVKFS